MKRNQEALAKSESWPAVWRAHWIWGESPYTADQRRFPGVLGSELWNRFCYLRREIELDRIPERVPARVTADSRYILYVNGLEVSRGPARTVPERIAYEQFDLSDWLQAGRNAIAALVRFYGRPVPWWRPTNPVNQLGFGSFAFEAPEIGVITDESWQGMPAPYLRDVSFPIHGLPPEILDGARIPIGWTKPGFDDSAWKSASVLEGFPLGLALPGPGGLPFSRPEPSDIAPLTELPVELAQVRSGWMGTKDAEQPLDAYEAASESGDPFQTYDAGRITLATPWMEVRGQRGGTVDVYAGEDLKEDGTTEISPRYYSMRYSLAGKGSERIEGFESVGFRYLTVVARGGADVGAVGATERRYPRESEAAFVCNDKRLNEIWEMGARTLDLCSTDAFIDCPGREQRVWLGDAYVQTLLAFVTNTDWRLARRNLRVCAQSQRDDGLLGMSAIGDFSLVATTIPCYSLHWIRTLTQYYEYSGDSEIVRELIPVAAQILQWFEAFRDEDGLLHNVPGWVFIDWAQTERSEITGALDALYALTLDDFGRLLDVVIGDTEGSARARTLADRTRSSFELLWDSRRGVYVDCAGLEGPHRRVSQQTNALAILSGAAPPDRWSGILGYVLDEARLVRTATPPDTTDPSRRLLLSSEDPALFQPFDAERDVVLAQPFFSHFLHQAVVRAGRRELLVDLCLRWYAQIERGNTTFEEYWDAPAGRASRCHAWACSPTYDLTTHILGVRPIEAGYTLAQIRPYFGRLTRLSGKVPTPHGLIEIDLTRDGGTLILPEPIAATVTFDDSDLGSVSIGPGSHRL